MKSPLNNKGRLTRKREKNQTALVKIIMSQIGPLNATMPAQKFKIIHSKSTHRPTNLSQRASCHMS